MKVSRTTFIQVPEKEQIFQSNLSKFCKEKGYYRACLIQPLLDFPEELGKFFFELASLAFKNRKQKIFNISEELRAEIESSKNILELKEGWEGKGSKGYKIETWRKLESFLINLNRRANLQYTFQLKTPQIYPGTDGGIDLHWKEDNYELFLSIPEEDDDVISYYGDDYGNYVLEGSSDINDVDVILSWLKKLH